ncbi:1,2-phenylacetyl-CoA epoxidase subunit PaaE [Amorphus sp. 3PC139-8]|uniref:1,2-phenylacetyl-CoA epoxidase subunit PaaE n=1 Tax=Amorphus sp. 3PC139-8 TaxID=2735676 RepID=UPI00345D1BF1
MSPRFHTLTIKDIRRETPDAVSIAFDVPADLQDAYHYEPGQYLTLKTDIEGEEVRRSYSICSGVDDGEIRVAVKKVDGGLFSTFANETLGPGTPLDVMTPMGRFVVPVEPEAEKVYVALAAGSGITPIMAQIKTILAREPKSHFFLFYGNRTAQSILFKDEIEDLKDRFLDRLSVVHVLSGETQDVPILSGRLDPEKVKAFLTHVMPASDVDHFLVCGPGLMIEGARKVLADLGVPEEKLHVELFTPAGSEIARRPPVRSRPAESITGGRTAEVILDGAATSVTVQDGETIIDASIRAGLDLPYSCKGGMCCTCRAKVLDGAVTMDVNYSLEPWELEAGFVLTCQSHPITDKVVLDYDAA